MPVDVGSKGILKTDDDIDPARERHAISLRTCLATAVTVLAMLLLYDQLVDASEAPPEVLLNTDPPGADILVNGAYTGLKSSDTTGVRFARPGYYYITFVRHDYLPLTVKLQVPLLNEGQTARFALDRVQHWEWASADALLILLMPVVVPLFAAIIMKIAGIGFANAFGLGTLGAILGLLVGSSKTPVVAVSIQAMLTFIGALAVYWFGTKSRTRDAGHHDGIEMGAYLVNFAIAFLVGLYVGGYAREAAPFFSEMRAKYWGLQASPASDATSAQPAPATATGTSGPHAPTTGSSDPPPAPGVLPSPPMAPATPPNWEPPSSPAQPRRVLPVDPSIPSSPTRPPTGTWPGTEIRPPSIPNP